MAFDSLSAFVQALRRAGELAEVDAPVDPRLEIAEITDRVVKAGGPALLFRSVRGSQFPVLTNAFGTQRRMALALGARSLHDVEERLRATIDLAPPETLGAKIGRAAGLALALRSAIPRRVEEPACREVSIDPPDLTQLPVLTTWPLDGGPFMTLPLVFTKDPESGRLNVGMYRVQVYDARTAAMHWQRHKQGRAHAAKWGRKVPVAIAVGGDPALTYAATAPLPPIVDELAFAG
ncbi:MAG: UbiD family decarboxylase, partial [Candidatus Eremiobacteraeota bacterium]|nr:UbiD family decarboxylase [Candidatus Eremiobacteraeota bacterium]